MSLRDLSAELRAIPKKLPGQAASAGARGVEAKAKASVPVATGKLRDSITAVASGDSIVVSAGVDYARFVKIGIDDVDYDAEIGEAVDAL
jgi:hypothetical protein